MILIGRGDSTLFWLDPCLTGGRLIYRFGRREFYGLSLGEVIKVNHFIRDGLWILPPATSNELIDIFDLIQSSALPSPGFEDEVIWKAAENGDFSLRSALTSNQAPPSILNVD